MAIAWEDFSLPDSPIRRSIGFDDDTHQIIVRSMQPGIEEILAANRDELLVDRTSSSLWGGRNYVKVASLPLWLIEQWRVEDGIDFLRWNAEDKARVMKRLNDRDFDRLRTAPGRI